VREIDTSSLRAMENPKEELDKGKELADKKRKIAHESKDNNKTEEKGKPADKKRKLAALPFYL